MSEFTFTVSYESGVLPEGHITHYGIDICVYPASYKGRDLPATLTAIKAMLENGTENVEAVFNIWDGNTGFIIINDVFILKWGFAYETVNCSKLTCSYSKNKEEINKFLKYFYDNYSNNSE